MESESSNRNAAPAMAPVLVAGVALGLGGYPSSGAAIALSAPANGQSRAVAGVLDGER